MLLVGGQNGLPCVNGHRGGRVIKHWGGIVHCRVIQHWGGKVHC